MDGTLQELAELLTEFLAATLLLDDVCKQIGAPLDFAAAYYKHFLSRHAHLIGLLLDVRLLLLLVLCEFSLTWSPAVFCVLTVLTPVRNIWIEPKSQDIATPCTLHLPFSSAMLTHTSAKQCLAITPLLSGLVPKSATFSSLLTLRTHKLLNLISSCIHKYATSLCFNLPIPCLWRMCFGGMASTGFIS